MKTEESNFQPEHHLAAGHETNSATYQRNMEPNASILASDFKDKYTVDWDGPHDPTSPLNWSLTRKWANLAIVSCLAFLTPLASSMFAPSVPVVMANFHSTNTELASFVVSIFVLGFAIGPIVVGPLSELYGRKPIYITSNILFVIFTLLCAEARTLGMLFAFRFLAGCAGSTPLTVGAGSVADLMAASQRGRAMALFSLGALLGPIVGPIIGGFVAESIGWRWIFRVQTIAAFCVTIPSLFMHETYAPILLERKARHLREKNNDPLFKSKYASKLSHKLVFQHAIIRPLKLLFMSPIVALISLHLSTMFGLLYLLVTTFTYIFEDVYGFSTSSAGLTFLGIGVGNIVGVIILGPAIDKIFNAYVKKSNGIQKPEFRLPVMAYTALFVPIGLFWYGWTARSSIHYIVPVIGCSFIGFGMMGIMLPAQNYLVDAFTLYSASAISAATILRSFFGAFLPLAGQPMYDSLGVGWGNSVLGFIAIAMIPIPWAFWKYGEGIRMRYPINLD
ncbi:putative MFS multidrug transporter [Mollisia scopiformis]|uniref:Putative MFS multidrug transporter n=1 Tax=Mollisia scopiformis TaxID=149040 RepID=A0A194XCM6_MOLSC|nr:putative MFS multidrug transporter [Mollisia scopiformis]KUJ17914.1 putative MFS multidrug transporter [Mollisia scopiformis]